MVTGSADDMSSPAPAGTVCPTSASFASSASAGGSRGGSVGSAADRAGLEARLGVMEELWSSKLLEAGFDTPLCISSQLHSLPVLRQQPIALVVQTKSTIATCRLDLGHLPPIAAEAARAGAPPRCEMQFELPLVRHGITVGCATGVLLVAPGIGGGAAELQAGQAASEDANSNPTHAPTRNLAREDTDIELRT